MASSSSLAATAATLSWSSSISLGNFGLKFNETAKISTRRGHFVIVANKKVKKFRQVILKEDVEHVGTKGKLCRVRAGFMRNYLLPLGLAQTATPDLLKEIRLEEERIEAEKQRVKEEAKQLALVFETAGAFKVKRKGGKGKQIFGTVTSQDLVDIIKSQLQRDVDKRIVTIPEIREVGSYIAELKLHPEVTALVRVTVSAI